ncbi:MAG: class I SAM-dependent methyltransferase [Nanoarchaeota archaeon]
MNRFTDIEKHYNDYYRSLLKSGKLLVKDTDIGFWGPSATKEVFEAFKILNVQQYQNFLDLGSGDGKVSLIAALFCRNSTGIEYDPILTGKANEMKDKLGIYNAKFINDDFFNHNLKPYDVIFHAPDKPLHRGVEEKLLKEMKGKLILHGHHFHPENLKRKQQFRVNNTLVTLYSR